MDFTGYDMEAPEIHASIENGYIYCVDCRSSDGDIYHPDDGEQCHRCRATFRRGRWHRLTAIDRLRRALGGKGDMWDDGEKKLVPVDEETADKNPDISFRVGEEIEVKGLRFEVDKIRAKRLVLRPLGRKLRREG